jgi:MraZ protein
MVMPWAGRQLLAIDRDAWPAFAAELKEARRTGSISPRMELVITSEATEEVPDGQGRISIPQRLRDYARIEKEVWFLGHGDRIQIVAAEAWDPQRDEALEELAGNEDFPV